MNREHDKLIEAIESLKVSIDDLRSVIGESGYNSYLGQKTTLKTAIEELSVKIKRMQNPITPEILEIIRKRKENGEI